MNVDFEVRVVRFVDEEPQPGIVEFELTDAKDQRHTFIDKYPIISADILDAHSAYPYSGRLRGEELQRFKDESGAELVRITTARPWFVESTEGLTEFVLRASQLSSVKIDQENS